jgi:superfamily II DNA helicase RecQ
MYGKLGIIRAFIPRLVALIAMSATFTPRVRRDVLSRLNMTKDHLYINEGNDRPNVSIVVRPIVHPLGSFKDLSFIIPSETLHPLDIPKTFLYADDVQVGYKIVDYLLSLLPTSLRLKGIIRPYNATHSHHYRAAAMSHFKAGSVRVLVCTDAAGMVCAFLSTTHCFNSLITLL